MRKLGSEEGLIPDLMKSNAQLSRALGLDDAETTLKGIGTELDRIRETTILDPAKQVLQQQEQSIRTLSGLYYDLFSGGTKNLWKDFERMGLEALAKLAAEKTFGAIAGILTGGAGGGIGAALGSIFHFANGGSFEVGGAPGVDQNVMSINGRPVAAVSAGERVAVIPRGMGNANVQARAAVPAQQSAAVEHRVIVEPSPLFVTTVQSEVVHPGP